MEHQIEQLLLPGKLLSIHPDIVLFGICRISQRRRPAIHADAARLNPLLCRPPGGNAPG